MNEKWTVKAYKDFFAKFGEVVNIEPQGAEVFHVWINRHDITLGWLKALEKELKKHNLRIFNFRAAPCIDANVLQIALVITPR